MSFNSDASNSSFSLSAAVNSHHSSPTLPEALMQIVSRVKYSSKQHGPFFPFPCQPPVEATTFSDRLSNGECCGAVQSYVTQALPFFFGSYLSKLEHSLPPAKMAKVDSHKVECNHSLSQQVNAHLYDDFLPTLSPKKQFKADSKLGTKAQVQADACKIDDFAVPKLPQSPKVFMPFGVLNRKTSTSSPAADFSIHIPHSKQSSAEKAFECSDADITSRTLVKSKLKLKRKWNESSTLPVAVPKPSFPRQKQQRTNANCNYSMLSTDDRDHKTNTPPLPSTVPPPISNPLKQATITSRQMKKSFKMTYEITEKIGSGGGGVVYSGKRIRDNFEVAIKRVFKEKVRRWGKLDGKSVPLEFELLHKATRFGNPGVVDILDWYERKSSFILVMERPQHAIDLFDYLKQLGPMTESVARKTFSQILDGVQICHENGVIHRDIKDENVIINVITGKAKIIDFGCGMHSQVAPVTSFAGTFEFYPPEWYIDHSYDCKQLDLWGLGVLLYTMVEGEIPFQSIQDIVKYELHFKRLSKHSLCRNLIELMLKKEPKDRLTMTEIWDHSWIKEDYRSTPCSLPAFTTSSPLMPFSIATSDESLRSIALPTTTDSRERSLLNMRASFEALSANNISSEASLSVAVTSTKPLNKTICSKASSAKRSVIKEYSSPTASKAGPSHKLSRRRPGRVVGCSALFKDYFSRSPKSSITTHTQLSTTTSEQCVALSRITACGVVDNDLNDYSRWSLSAVLKTHPRPCVVRS